jgi:hypothetical protein
MTMVTIKSGGGINSNKTVQSRSGVKVEPKAQAANVAGVAQQGMATAFKKEPLIQGKGYEPQGMGPTGIANATKGPAGAGPGGMGRTIYRSGSQSPTPPAHEMPAGRNTLAEYGTESVTSRGKR